MDAIADFAIAGGPVIWLLGVLSFCSLILIALKFFDLWLVTSGRNQRDDALSKLNASGTSALSNISISDVSPANRLLIHALGVTETDLPERQIESELERRGNQEVSKMNRFLRVLEVVAMVGPLLGLLGTVLGMIESFQQLELEGGSANAAVLAGGIWKALLTTAAGLIVAIPAAVAAHLFGAKVEIATLQMEDTVSRYMEVRRNLAGPTRS